MKPHNILIADLPTTWAFKDIIETDSDLETQINGVCKYHYDKWLKSGRKRYFITDLITFGTRIVVLSFSSTSNDPGCSPNEALLEVNCYECTVNRHGHFEWEK